ncbi:hypothetical protein [Lactiplantibacillus modestisalitolerans]|uniref:Uncharacterized protein n=1 Tax=Lactiplantibacillus modestisalitolerans TaxID=1457219 RepID=A0ABV5WTV0_9LACO
MNDAILLAVHRTFLMFNCRRLGDWIARLSEQFEQTSQSNIIINKDLATFAIAI